MIRLPISQLEPDMILGAPIRHPSVENHTLLRAGYCLDADTIANLERLSIGAVWICHAGFDFLDGRLSDVIPASRDKLYRSVKRSFSGIADKVVGAFNPVEYRSVISDMITNLIAHKDHAVWAERLMAEEGELFGHCSNVAYLSLVIGMRIKDYIFAERKHVNYGDGTDLTNLGIGAMLHDLGKLGLDPEWRDVHYFEEAADNDEYRSHADRGYKAVRDLIEATASQTMLNHHQRFDGHGFPLPPPRRKGQQAVPMKGRSIHVFSRIVAVANTIDGLMSVCRRQNLPIVAALAAIQMPPFEGMFDPIVLDAALRTVPPFPLGSRVELSDGRLAVVTDLNEPDPCRPVVRLLEPPKEGDGYGELNLSEPGEPSIVMVGDQPVRATPYTLPRTVPAIAWVESLGTAG